ncbi:MAG TPA: tetratricopeptide repeat protein, partial [Steroidobacteraceae bacterium]|nr:tetratricopeptide repeat protein [Steroidobacteraceae bacterium]
MTETESSVAAAIDAGDALRKAGRLAEALARYDAAILADPRCAAAHLSRGNLLQQSARVAEARSAYQKAIACDPRYAAAHFNLGNLNYRAGEWLQAVRNYRATIDLRPQFADAFIGMANALAGLGHTAEARQSYQHALTLDPRHAEAHFNLGVLEMTQGHADQAAASLSRAVAFRPEHAPAHRLLGVVLNGLGNFEGAEASLRRACALDPQSAEALYDLAMLLEGRGSYAEAAHLLALARQRAPSPATQAAFADCAARARFTARDPLVRAELLSALTEAWRMPHDLCRPALDLILLEEPIAACVRRANASWPARPSRAALFGADGLAALSAEALLIALLAAVPLNSIELERFLTCARHALLEAASGEAPPAPADLGALVFYAALARQCFLNEYVFDCPESEKLAAAGCRARLLALLDAGEAAPALLLLAVAACFPLYLLPGADRLLAGGQPAPVEEVLRQQIREPLEEQALRADIPCLTPIADSVSAAVREQYEQSPYPRWTAMHLREDAPRFNEELRRLLPLAQFTPLPDDSAPEVLVAGCGTGSDAILVARQFRGARVLAIDLSLGSLSYARRKTRELRLGNIEYAQADILELGSLGRTFDVIGAIGVLHHLADPFRGWRTLLTRLRPGGLMRLGLYSRTARRVLVRAREFIEAQGFAPTPDGIRSFRQAALAEHAGAELRALTRSRAFYSMSDCRDLAFNVQERTLTLEEIGSFLGDAGLRLVGFELEPQVLGRYRARFGADPACTDLRNWSVFEAAHPDTFTGMYRFWV